MNMQVETFSGELGQMVSLPETVTVSLGKVARKFYGGDLFSREVLQALVEHGLKQKLGDAYNVHKGTDAEKMAKADKVWDSLKSGKFRVRRQASDLVEKYARQLGLKYLANVTTGWDKMSTDDRKDLLDAFLESAETEDKAAAIYDKAEKMAELERSLSDLDI